MSCSKITVIILVLLNCLIVNVTSGVNIFVATNGSDANPGTEAKPFQTLTRAKEAIRSLRATGTLPRAGISITVHGGIYLFDESLTLGPDESGTVSAPIIWTCATNEEVRLCGGKILLAKSFHPVDDKKILERLSVSARNRVLQADVQGVGRLGCYPNAFRGAPVVPELFYNDQRQSVACWPNEGWATIDKIFKYQDSIHDTNRPLVPADTFGYNGDHPNHWDADAGVWLLGYWSYDWWEETIKVKSIDRERHLITLSEHPKFGIAQGNPSPRRYRAVNLLEELDQPGEYYLDLAGSRLFFWPPSEMANSRIVLSTLDAPLIRLTNACSVILRGFIVEDGLSNGIEVIGGNSNRIESCIVRNLREKGVVVTGGASQLVENCDIHDTGTGGIVMEGGDRKTLTPAGDEVLNNRIWRYSQLQYSYASGITLSGVGNRAAHNEIYEAPHMAVSIKGNDHVFEFNYVHDVCTESDDSGALYKGRDPSSRGNVIRYNYWRDIGSPMGHGTAAIYFDDGDGGDTVFGNVFVRCGYPGKGGFGTVFSHGGFDIHADNNIFIECKRALGSSPWNDKHWKAELLTHNRANEKDWQDVLLKDVDITRPPYTTHYPELIGFMNPPPGLNRFNFSSNNVLFKCEQVSCGNWTNAPGPVWVTDFDPGFVNYSNGNLELLPDSDVFKHLPTFDSIPFEMIGIHGRN